MIQAARSKLITPRMHTNHQACHACGHAITNSLIIDPSKVIFGSLGVAWCASTNLQSGRSASLSWKGWFTKQAFALAGNISIEMVKALITGRFCERLLCQICQCQALSTDSSHLSTLKILRQIMGLWEWSRPPRFKPKKKSNRSIQVLHPIILARTSGCNRSDKQTSHSSIRTAQFSRIRRKQLALTVHLLERSPIIPRELFPCQLEPQKIYPSKKVVELQLYQPLPLR